MSAPPKPAPEMFRAALLHTDVREQQMIHVGDNPIDDIHGAADLGIPTIWVQLRRRAIRTRRRRPASSIASRTFRPRSTQIEGA